MKIKDIMLYFPRGILSSISKMYRAEMDDKMKEQIIKEGMYHFVPNEQTAEAILKSEHLRPASGGMKYINSYGTPVACLFCGKPEVDNFIKNVTTYKIDKNPYVNPTMVATAVKVLPTDKEELKNYKIRSLSDNAALYEGFCVLPHEKISIKKMVPDLVRDEEDTPIMNKNGDFTIAFREAKENEYELGNQNEDYINYIRKKAIEFGYSKNNNTITGKVNNYLNNVLDQSRMESESTQKSIRNNITGLIENIKRKISFFINNFGVKKIEEPTEYVIDEFKFKRKNPFQDKKFGEFVADLQSKEGIEQVKLKKCLMDLRDSKIGNFLFNKYNGLDYTIKENGIHGKSHTDRVILNSCIIAQKEDLFKEDTDDRMKDILITAAAYHDIGRIGDIGPHAKRSARKINKMNLKFSNGKNYSKEDKKLLMAIVESHEGKPDKIEQMLKKYSIKDLEEQKLARNLSQVLRDSDALDRVRLDIVTPTNTKVNLQPKFLKTNAAKSMLTESYELENLTSKNTMQTILNSIRTRNENEFNLQYKVNVVQNKTVTPAVKTIKEQNDNQYDRDFE